MKKRQCKYNVGDYIGPNHDILILERNVDGNSKRIRLKCPVCGNEQWIVDLSTIHKDVKRCYECYKKERIQQFKGTKYKAGDKIGPYDVELVRYIKTSSMNGSVKSVCEFICPLDGQLFTTRLDHVISGATWHCDSCKETSGEKLIANILNKYNIGYISQYGFQDTDKPCRNPQTGYLLRFDFYLPDYSCCIEYDGKQHFVPIDHFGGQKAFERTKQRDKIKDEYCLTNRIKLCRIDYKEKKENVEKIVVDFLRKSR